MWDFLKGLTNNIFGLIGTIIFTPVILAICILALPFMAIASCVNICLHDRNRTGTSTANMDNLSQKLNEIESTIDERKLSNIAIVMEKMQKLGESNNKVSKAEMKTLRKEFKHEIKSVESDLKSNLTKEEYKAVKKELKKEFKPLHKEGSKSTIFQDNDFNSAKEQTTAPAIQTPVFYR